MLTQTLGIGPTFCASKASRRLICARTNLTPWTAHYLRQRPGTEKHWPTCGWGQRWFAHRYKLIALAGLSAMAATTGKSMQRRGLLSLMATAMATGGLILLDGLLLKHQGTRRVATHEIGHFLAFHHLLAQPDGFLPQVQSVFANPTQGGMEHSYVDPSPQGVATRMMALAAASEMEKLVYGYHIPMGAISDRIQVWQLALSSLVKLLIHSPDGVPAFLKFWWSHAREANTVLKQYDPATVKDLTQTLVQDKQWSAYRIQEVLQAAKLAHPEPENQQ